MRKGKKILSVILSLAMVAGLVPAFGITSVSAEAAVRYEAENATLPEGAGVGNVTWSNVSGEYYVEKLDGASIAEANYVTFDVDAEKAGTYQLKIGYLTTENTQIAVSVNESEWQTVSVSSTGSWDVSSEVIENITLNQGKNTIKVTGSVDGQWANLDYIEIESLEGYIIKTATQLVADGNIKMEGRSADVGTAKSFDWTASGFEFVYEGSGTVSADITASMGASNSYAELEINVDGTTSRTTVWGTQDVILADNLADGEYTIKVNKVNEAGFGLAQLNSIKFPEDGTLTATDTSDIKFEIIGDSITCGNGIAANVEDGMASYAHLLAEMFSAEANILSVSGRGLMTGWDQENGWALGNTAEMNTIYNYTSYFRDKSTLWDKASYEPDVIIVNLGNNDLGPATGVSATEYCQEVVNFSNQLRSEHPEATILWVYGIFVNRSYSDEIQQAVAGLNDSKISYIYMDAYGGGSDGHPNYEQHKEIANILAENISELTGLTYEGGTETEAPSESAGRYEAENAILPEGAGTQYYDWSSFSGKGYVEGLDGASIEEAKYVTFNVDAEKAGTYQLKIGYATTENTQIAISVNEGDWKSVSTPSTGDWSVAAEVIENIVLNEGTNTIKVTGSIDGQWANLDYIEIAYIENSDTDEIPAAVGRHEAENADYGTNTLQNDSYYAGTSNGAVVGINAGWVGDPVNCITQKVNAENAGTYTLTVAYAVPAQIELMAQVNGGEWQVFSEADPETKVLPASADWNQTATATMVVELLEGENTISISGPMVDWDSNWYQVYGGDWTNVSAANLDYFELAEYVETVKTYNVTIDGEIVETVEDGNEYTLPSDAEYGYFDGTDIYKADSTITVTENKTFTSVNELSVTVLEGAGIRLDGTTGIRFQATISAKNLAGENISELVESSAITEGMLITTNDFYTEGKVLDFDSTYQFINVENSGWFNNQTGTYCGSVIGIDETNYIRDFIARAYVTINYAGETVSETIYSNMTGARSINYVANAIINSGELSVYTSAQQELIEAYAAVK